MKKCRPCSQKKHYDCEKPRDFVASTDGKWEGYCCCGIFVSDTESE